MKWLTVFEAASALGVSDKTIRRRCKKKDFEFKYVSSSNAKGGNKTLMVRLIDPASNQPGHFGKTYEGKPEQSGQIGKTSDNYIEQDKGSQLTHSPAENPGSNKGEALSASPALMDPKAGEPEPDVPSEYLEAGRLRSQLCKYAMALWGVHSKAEALKITVDLYNGGAIVAALKTVWPNNSKISERTLRSWLTIFKGRENALDLVPNYKIGAGSKSTITEEEEKFILKWFLTPNQIQVGSIISHMKNDSIKGILESPSSESTIRRWLQEYEEKNENLVALMRKGEKFCKDNMFKHIERNASLLDVGDVWVADGNVLNFMIINPTTGKPQRMIFVPWMDWRSRFIVGGAIAPTEDTMNIAAAFRNAVLNWGGTPKAILIDNGRAFKSRYFCKSKKQDVDLESNLGGLFSRLKVEEHFATPYNARAKPIERWFKTFNNGFERWLSGYRGASIGDQPANLNRNEKWLQRLSHDEPFTLDEAQMLIGYYITNYYHKSPHEGLPNKASPELVFKSHSCPAHRQIAPATLNYLMLKGGVKKVGPNGIRFNKINYWHPDLVGMVGQEVVFKYDWHDLRYILIYRKNKLICTAGMNHQHHPMISLDPNRPISEKMLKEELKHQSRVMRMTKKLAKAELDRVSSLDGKVAAIQMDDSSSFLKSSRLLDPPKKKLTQDEKIAAMDTDETIQELTPESTITNEDDAELKELKESIKV